MISLSLNVRLFLFGEVVDSICRLYNYLCSELSLKRVSLQGGHLKKAIADGYEDVQWNREHPIPNRKETDA